MTVLRSLAYHHIDDLLLVVHHFGDLDDADWQTLVRETSKLCPTTDKCLVFPGETRLTRSQSTQIAKVVCRGRMRVAVLLEGRAARGAVAALGWLTKRYRAFAPESVAQALSYLNISPERHAAIFQTLDDLGRSMSRPTAEFKQH